MSNFRIYIYLKIKYFFLSFFLGNNLAISKITTILNKITNKKRTILTSQLRAGFLLVLKYLIKKYPKKKEIIVNSYNLAEMVSICRNLKLKIVYTQLNDNLFICEKDLKKKINKKTLAVVATNIFNTFNNSKKIKNICNKKKVPLIEDNAIYFGNYKKLSNKKIFAGSFGDYSLNSFNIMKNISAMYGGSISTNDKKFASYANNEITTYKNFPLFLYLKQCLIFLILKILTINFIYRLFFLNLIKKANVKKNFFILSLVYPSLKFRKQYFPNYYFTGMNRISKNMIFLQLNDKKNFDKNHIAKKNNNMFYSKLLNEKKVKGLKLVKCVDSNYQNFNDFPIIVDKKSELVNYLFSKGIETKTVQYVDCQKIFKSNKKNEKLNEYENKVLCLPNHKQISKKYIEYIVGHLRKFYINGNVQS